RATSHARAITPPMPAVDWIRELCLSFPDATEKLQWGGNLCFKVRGKIFAIVDLSERSLAPITLKCAPEQFHDLLEIEGIAPAPYVGRYKWILLENSNILPSDELEALIRQSYGLVMHPALRRTRGPHSPVVRSGHGKSAQEEIRERETAQQSPQKVKAFPRVPPCTPWLRPLPFFAPSAPRR